MLNVTEPVRGTNCCKKCLKNQKKQNEMQKCFENDADDGITTREWKHRYIDI